MTREGRSDSILLLTRMQYCHIIDQNSGEIRLVEGPFRGPLESNEAIFGSVENKRIVEETQYAIIQNPYSEEEKDVKMGGREVRVGPCIFSLYPGEHLEGGRILDQYVLGQDQGLLLQAARDFVDGPDEASSVQRRAGDRWVIEGPTTYIPHKFARVLRQVEALSLGQDEGIYIKNLRSGAIRLETGPRTLMLSPEEELHQKSYMPDELEALKLPPDFAETTASVKALPLRLHTEQVAMIMEGSKTRLEFGPKTFFLQPFENLHILRISGGTPKVAGLHKLWKLSTGPVFSTDLLSVRTRDNALLSIRLRYKNRFVLDAEMPEKIFAVADFIGYMTETLGGIIREEAAKHDFEDFHANATNILQSVIFGVPHASYVFEENNHVISALDIKEIAPSDPDIARQLNDAIKANMQVYTDKIQQEARLEAERQLVAGRIRIESEKKALIELEQENLRTKAIGEARITANAAIETAKGEAEAMRIQEESKTRARADLVRATLEALERNPDVARLYIALQQVDAIAGVQKIIVPTDSRFMVPLGDISDL